MVENYAHADREASSRELPEGFKRRLFVQFLTEIGPLLLFS